MALTRPRSYQLLDSDFKDSCRAATTTNIANLSGGAPNVIDGVNLNKRDRILVKNQTTRSQNGIYYIQTLGSGSNGVWIRSADFNADNKISAGMQVAVEEGLLNKDTVWQLITNNPIVLNSSNLDFALATDTGAVTNVYYVSESGSDTYDGTTLARSFASIDKALTVATNGSTIFIKSGDYTITNPLTIPTGVSLIGDNLRTTTIRPTTTNADMFYVNNGCYVAGFTFKDHVSPAAAFAYNPNGSAGVITRSPYIQNCTSITTTGTGMRIDGAHCSGLRSMVTDAFTQINAGGIGIHIKNKGYAQLVSIFTIATDISVFCESGGQCSITNSNTSFGNYGLKATGTSPTLYTGTVSGSYLTLASEITLSGLSQRPNYGDAVKFASDTYYYQVLAATPLSSGSSTITIDIGLKQDLPTSTGVTFHQRSLISASSHTFEYCGSGTTLATALPQSGGVPIQENEIVQDANGAGQIYFTSTDQQGDFRIGGELVINRASGTITGTTFDRSLFAVLTPYILALES
jgi:hypothetical protein